MDKHMGSLIDHGPSRLWWWIWERLLHTNTTGAKPWRRPCLRSLSKDAIDQTLSDDAELTMFLDFGIKGFEVNILVIYKRLAALRES
jgi:hypothetical protein